MKEFVEVKKKKKLPLILHLGASDAEEDGRIRGHKRKNASQTVRYITRENVMRLFVSCVTLMNAAVAPFPSDFITQVDTKSPLTALSCTFL